MKKKQSSGWGERPTGQDLKENWRREIGNKEEQFFQGVSLKRKERKKAADRMFSGNKRAFSLRCRETTASFYTLNLQREKD